MDLTKNIKLKVALFLTLSVLFLVFGLHDTVKADTNSDVHINYKSHVQSIGWQDAVSDGATSGTTDKSLRLEALNIDLSGDAKGMSISYQTHVQKIGWMDWTSQGQMAGTEGKALRLEAVKIKLNNAPSNYHVQYQVHVQNIGWTNWVEDGQIAGTTGRALRIEAIRIKIVKDKNLSDQLNYQSHVQSIGWQNPVSEGNVSGTEGKNARLEALDVTLPKSMQNMSISYQSHVQSIGWTDWVQDGDISGTVGKGLRLEAVKIKLNNAPSNYHVQYQVNVQSKGWTGWVQDGEMAGTEGQALRVEAIRIKIVKADDNSSQQKKLEPKICIDTPKNNSSVSENSVAVKGWSLNSNTSGVKQVTVSVDGSEVGNASIGQARSDVDNVYPGYSGGANSGYSYNLDMSKLSNGQHTIVVKSIGNDGITISQSIIINKPGAKTIAIAIDIGHNAPHDSGATGLKQEDEVTMEVGQKVISKLQAKGYNVISTKPATATSVEDSLQQRVDAANNGNAELFISIHANVGGGQGTEVWAGGSQKSIDLAKNILKDIVALGYRDRGVKVQGQNGYQHLYVLNNTNMPAVLVETFFLDSQSDMNKYNPESIANAIVNGILSTLN